MFKISSHIFFQIIHRSVDRGSWNISYWDTACFSTNEVIHYLTQHQYHQHKESEVFSVSISIKRTNTTV